MKFIISTAAAVLLSTSAFAADAVFVNDPIPAAQVPAYLWSGAYIGLNAGYAGGKAEATDGEFGISATGNGFVGGVQAGYNWQSGSAVYGIETDIQYSDVSVEIADFDIIEIDWFGSTRLRAGFLPTDRFLVYATGGVAYGKYSVDLADLSDTRVGWTVGAGVEYAIDDKWSLKTEYLYTDLGSWDIAVDEGIAADVDFKFHTVRAGLNFKF